MKLNFAWKLYVTPATKDNLKNEDDIKNYETYNNERKVKVFASNSESQISCNK